MERRQIRELIGRFLHNDVPGELQTQFRRWMLQPGDGDEKEAALREEWTAVVESPAAADRSEELQRLRHTRSASARRVRSSPSGSGPTNGWSSTRPPEA